MWPTTVSSDHLLDNSLENLDLPIFPHKGTRNYTSTYFIMNLVSYDYLSFTSRSLIVSLDSIPIAKIVKKTLKHLEWSDVILDEIHALEEKHMWSLVYLPTEKKAVGCK